MKTRTRTLSSQLQAGFLKQDTYSWPSGAFVESSTSPSSAATYSSLVETITDEDPKRQYMGYCKHSKTRLSYNNSEVSLTFVEGPKYVRTYGGGYLAREILWPRSYLITGVLPVDTIDWSSLSFQAMRAMRPSLNEGLLLAPFIKELGNPKDLWKKFRRFKDEIRRDGVRNWLKHRWNQFKNNPQLHARRGAEANLWYQFGLRPFLNDCVQIYEGLRTLEERINQVLADAGKRRIVHYSRGLELVKLPHVGDKEVYNDYNYKNVLYQKYEFCSRPRYSATLVYVLNADELRGLLGKVRGFISTMGLDKILTSIWEFIPYSFVVDWFVDVGGFLESLDDELFGALPITVVEFCHSVKFEYQTTITWKSWVTESLPGSVPRVYAMATLGQQRTSFYERRRDVPSLFDIQSAQGLTVNRTGLAASLGYSKYSRRRG